MQSRLRTTATRTRMVQAVTGHYSCAMTFVSLYVNILSQHRALTVEYASWIHKLKGVCLLVFTDYPELWQTRYKVIFIKTDLYREPLVLNQSGCFWHEQREQDPEAGIHESPLVYLAWNLKAYFVKEGVHLNLFYSKWLF